MCSSVIRGEGRPEHPRASDVTSCQTLPIGQRAPHPHGLSSVHETASYEEAARFTVDQQSSTEEGVLLDLFAEPHG